MKILKIVAECVRILLFSKQLNEKAENWRRWRSEVSAAKQQDLRDSTETASSQVKPVEPKRTRKRKVKPETRQPLDTSKLKQVRTLFNSEYVSRETNRHNQKAWVKALRTLHNSSAETIRRAR